MRRIIITVCLFLSLCLAAPALAAPSRDVRTLNDGGEALETAVSLFGGAALLRDVYDLEEGGEVPQALTEGVLLLGYSRSLLPNGNGSPADAAKTVDAAAVQDLLPQLFAGPAAVGETPSCPCIVRQGDSLVFDVSDVDTESAGGGYVFSSWQDGKRVTVLADLYTTIDGFGEDLDVIPEECLTWMRTAQFVLEQDENALLGYRLVSMVSYPEWLEGAVSEWELTMGEDYEVNLPTFFHLDVTDEGADTYKADQIDAKLTVAALPASGEDPLAAALEEYASAHPEAAIVMEAELGHFTAETDGAYVMYVRPEESDTLRVVTLTFPSERQYEFSFYGEIIRNSFYCEGMGLG